ncbi:MAG: hypothetical protein SGJ01_08460 [Gemmatimonadota bacterium]|nr:hypothetical protein [Gemmatimonadota bacterium]
MSPDFAASRKSLPALLALLMLAVVPMSISRATVVTVTMVVDGTVQRAGGIDYFNDHRYNTVANLLACCGGPVEARGVEEFSLPSLDGTVVSAQLSVALFSLISGGGTVDVWGYRGNGLIDGAPLAPAPTGIYAGSFPDFDAGDTLLGTFDFYAADVGSRVELDVTGFLSTLVASGGSYAGFNFRLAANPFSRLSIRGDAATLADATYLRITTLTPVPLPPAALLFASALSLLLTRRRSGFSRAPQQPPGPPTATQAPPHRHREFTP